MASDSESAKEMEARMSEILAIRAAQDNGNFKIRPSWDPAISTTTTVGSVGSVGSSGTNTASVELNWNT